MAAATDMGLPLSVARGARLPGEAWTGRDWALAQAAHRLDKLRCPGCGWPLWIARNPAYERLWYSGPPERCHPCTSIAKRRKQYEESDHAEALHFRAELMA